MIDSKNISLQQIVAQGDPDALYVVPFGGVGEFGMNCTGYVSGGQLFIVDCGLMFPDPTKLGVDSLILDLDEHISSFGGVSGYIITHGHEDHLGALPFVAQRWPAQIFGTAWTIEVLKSKLERQSRSSLGALCEVVRPGDLTSFDKISFEWVHVNHSIPMTCALAIRTPHTVVFHTGDFKFDLETEHEAVANLPRIAAIGAEGVAALLCDSTNASTPRVGPNERNVRDALRSEIATAPSTVFVSTFSSNLWRILTLIEICQELSKKLLVLGSGMKRVMEIASSLGLLPENLDCLVEETVISRVKRKDLVVVLTGCQGEPGSALQRIANGESRHIALKENDTVIFSSRVIPGNEIKILAIQGICAKMGVRVVTHRTNPNIHSSGHACAPEIEQMIKSLNPKFLVPVHGTDIHLQANSGIGFEVLGQAGVVQASDGMVLRIESQSVSIAGQVATPRLFVDSWSQVPMPLEVLRDRLRIGSAGLAIATGTITRQGSWICPLTVDLIGLPLPANFSQDPWLSGLSGKISQLVSDASGQGPGVAIELNEATRLLIRKSFLQILKKKPPVVSKLFISDL